MDLAELTAKANEALNEGAEFDKVVKFDFGSMGQLVLDGAKAMAHNEDSAADVTVGVDWDDFQKLIAGQLDPTMAFMTGKLKVSGDMGVAMKLQSVLTKLM